MKIKKVFRNCLVVTAAVGAFAGVSQAECVPPKAGDVLVTGGEDLNENAAGNTEFFDPGTGTWMTGCPTKSAHDEAQIVVTGGRILVIGGETRRRIPRLRMLTHPRLANSARNPKV
jgi:hypothetical protein